MLVVYILKQAACLVLGIEIIRNPVLSRQEDVSTANKTAAMCSLWIQCDLVRFMCPVRYPGSSRSLAPNS